MRLFHLLVLALVLVSFCSGFLLPGGAIRPLLPSSQQRGWTPLASSSSSIHTVSSISTSSTVATCLATRRSRRPAAASTSNDDAGDAPAATSREDYLRSLLWLSAGTATATVAARAASFSSLGDIKPAQAMSADDIDDDKPQTIQAYLEDIDKLNLKISDFPKALEWVNVAPLSIQKDLRGKLVLLDFWTFCCINCQLTLPTLAKLEKKYAKDPFVVVGVHSAKFDNEKETANIREAISRYHIEHPVVNDKDMQFFQAAGVNSWPTLLLLGPRGNVLSIWPGEANETKIDTFLTGALEYYKDKGVLDNKPLVLGPPASGKGRGGLAGSPLNYPGKLHLDPAQPRIFVSDSGNNRVLVVDRNDGSVLESIGSASGEGGFEDGTFEAARFSNPQGLCLSADRKVLYVCDTEAHALRAIDLEKKVVSTVAGNGEQGFDYSGGKAGKAQYLSSPWDVVLRPSSSSLLVAMAGTHQLWEVEVPSGKARCYSGTGREAETNAVNRIESAWAQPSGIALGPNAQAPTVVYVADSESSTVREMSLEGSGRTRTLVGGAKGTSLFAYGDKDGKGAAAKLQHPLGVATTRDGMVVVADSYNHKLKVVDPETRTVKTLVGSGKAGLKDGKLGATQFWEPGGLAADPQDAEKIWVADTNNHALRVLDIATNEVSTFPIKDSTGGGSGGEPQQTQARSILNRRRARVIDLGVVGAKATIKLQVTVPNSLQFTETRPSEWQLVAGKASGKGQLTKETKNKGSATISLDGGSGMVEVESAVYYCEEEKGVCRSDGVIFRAEVKSGGPSEVVAAHLVELPTAAKSKVGAGA